MPIYDPAEPPTWLGHWPDPEAAGHHLVFDFESEADVEGSGEGDSDVHWLTIADPEGQELAAISHRVSHSPLDGEVAVLKQLNAKWIADALDAYDVAQPTLDDARRASALAAGQPTPHDLPQATAQELAAQAKHRVHALQGLIERGLDGSTASAVFSAHQFAQDPELRRYIRAAQTERGVDGDVEIDDDAMVSEGVDPGAFVQAWIWVDDPDRIEP